MTDNDENQGNTRRDDTSSDVQSDWRQDSNSGDDSAPADKGSQVDDGSHSGEDASEDPGLGL